MFFSDGIVGLSMGSQQVKQYEVSAGILVNDGQILCLQRGLSRYDYTSYRFEFPGGKLEPGENPTEALRRELSEEMHITIDESSFEHFMTVRHTYPDFTITMHAYTVNVESRAFDLVEHVDYRWLDAEELDTLDWAEADWPIVDKLMVG